MQLKLQENISTVSVVYNENPITKFGSQIIVTSNSYLLASFD